MSQDTNLLIARQLLAGIGKGQQPDVLAAMFAEDLQFEIQGDDGVLQWVGRKTGRDAALTFSRGIRDLTEPVSFEVEDILAGAERAVIVGALETRIKATGRVIQSEFAIILTIAGGAITRFQMPEHSFGLSRAARPRSPSSIAS